MARKAILDTYYTFTPSTRTLVIPRAVPRERLILVTDVTTNQVIYNFSDPNLTATSYVVAPSADNSSYTTTVTLNYNTTTLNSTDKLQIIVDEYDEKFSPSESYMDAVNKLRVSTPQALIDTDFEYSTQQTKWEQLAMINNRPFAYYSTATSNIGLVDINPTFGSRSYSANVYPITTASSPGYGPGNVVTVIDSTYAGADGTYIIDSNPSTYTLSYTGKYYYTGNATSIYNNGVTQGYFGNIYSNANIAISGITSTGNLCQVVTGNPHGLGIGNEFALINSTATAFAPNGSWVVSTVSNSTAFSFYTINAPSGTITTTSANLFVRPLGLTLHRPLQAGIRFSTNGQSHNQQYIRQTRRYFRYQSGKGIQMSTGTNMKSNFVIDSLTYSSTTNLVTVRTKDQHNLTTAGTGVGTGQAIYIANANESGYNGTFTVFTVVDPYTFTYTPATVPTYVNPATSIPGTTAVQATGPYVGGMYSWYGSYVRVGLFDNQNGVYFEHDGQNLYACRRSSTAALSGTISATPGSSVITGTNTAFSKQLQPNDFIVIKGMSYRIVDILSDGLLTVSPQYRGAITIANALYSKTVETRIPQSQWNIDRCDGTGPSGFKQDFTKMQMFYIDYSWYGAGFIRFGFRAADGNVVYCHRMINNNVQQVGYMRSGNLPARYETHSMANTAIAIANIASTDTSILLSTLPTPWPPNGTAVLRNVNQREYVYFTGNTINANGTAFLTGITYRGQAGATQTCTYTAGNSIITTANTVGLQPGMYILGNGIPAQSFISSITANATVTISTAPFWSNTQPLIFAPLGQTAQVFTANTQAPTAVELHAPQFNAEVNHWGTSAIMDGGFTPDKAFIFTKGMTNFANVYAGQSNAIMSFRISPSASGGVPGTALGIREVINHMQMIPYELDAYSNGSFLMSVVLNGTVSNAYSVTGGTTAAPTYGYGWQQVGGSSLAQYLFHPGNTTVAGGETIFGFFMNTTGGGLPGGPGPGTTYNTTQQDFSQVRDLGTSILSGGTASGNTGIYPDGPDVMTIVATNISPLGSYANLVARMSWTEAQA